MLVVLKHKYSDASDKLKSAAKDILLDEDASAETVWHATHFILGPDAADYLGETRRKAFSDGAVSIAASNLDKFNATVALLIRQNAFVDAVTFEDTVLAYNGHENNVELLEEATPSQILYGLSTILSLLRGSVAGEYMSAHPDFSGVYTDNEAGDVSKIGSLLGAEVISYVALMHYIYGCVAVLPELVWASASLKNMIPKESWPLRRRVDDRAQMFPSNDILASMVYKETQLDVQLAHLAAARLYADDRLERDRDALDSLTKQALA